MKNDFVRPPAAFAPVEISFVSRSAEEQFWDELVRRHHFLAYRRLLGHPLKYLAYIRKQPVAAFSLSAAALKSQARDRCIGWDQRQQQGGDQPPSSRRAEGNLSARSRAELSPSDRLCPVALVSPLAHDHSGEASDDHPSSETGFAADAGDGS